jgi:hypothetical protein
MNNKEIKVIDELTKINIELKQKNQEQQRVLDKIKEYINDDTVFDGSAMCKNDLDKLLEEIE